VRRSLWAAWLPRSAGRAAARCLLLVAVLAVPAQAIGLLVGPGPAGVARTVAVTAASALCLLRAVLVAADRVAWAALGIGLVGWAYFAWRWALAGLPVDELSAAIHISPLPFYACGLICVALLLRARIAGPVPRGLAFDGLIGLLAAGAAGVAAVGPRLHTGGGLAGAVTLAYVLADVALLGMLLVVATATGFHGKVWWALSAGYGLVLATDGLFWLSASLGSLRISGLEGLGWSTGVVVAALAAWTRPVTVRQLRLRAWAVLAVPTLSTAVALGVLLAAGYTSPHPAAAVLATAAIALAATRAALALNKSFLVVTSHHDAATDELTGLANRRRLLARLDAASAGGQPHALVLLDLNRFKEINDTLGHPVGDELLRRLGPRLAGTARPGETAARLGGDEFAVLVPGVDTEAAALRAARRVLAGLLGAFVIDGLTLFVTASAGVALAPRHGGDGPTLLRCADVAMYQAKRSGGGAAVYRPLADPHSRSRLGAATELKRAIAAGDIVCHYQPQVEVPTRLAVGAEALARWRDGRRGLVPPEEFLALAEQTGLMPGLTEAVLRTALADVRSWRIAVPHLRVAVNLSASSLLDSRLPDRVETALAAAGLPAEALELEIADGTLPDAGRARATVARLHELGVGVALDDYGRGRSSVLLLRHLPVDQLKLDGGLVDSLVDDPRARAIARHTVEMAHALHMQVVAKGVEDGATMDLVEQLGCDRAQGFLLAGPMPAVELTGWLAARTPVPG
jgi:diguanylate cyclase